MSASKMISIIILICVGVIGIIIGIFIYFNLDNNNTKPSSEKSVIMNATIVSNNGDHLLVNGKNGYSGQYDISAKDKNQADLYQDKKGDVITKQDLSSGDLIAITFSGTVYGSEPSQVKDATKIQLLD